MLKTVYPKARPPRTSLLQSIALERRLLKKALTRHKDAVRANEKKLAQLALDVRGLVSLGKPLPKSWTTALSDAAKHEVALRQRAAKWRRQLRELDERELKEVQRLNAGGWGVIR